MRRPGQRVEPLEAEQDKGDVVRHQVAGAVVSEFMVERQPPLAFGKTLIEIERNDDDWVEDAKGHRAPNAFGPDQPDAADPR